ncbi:hypothetical protein GF386_05415 [Candidatus Pacearchaeota archaeon]|nr:hypothetical protein [Candidatus Pacearchaeota archaeon]MBD3283529.1 hypothetical protein [Candidatus Pacearchaeota archaeon]
MVRVCQDWYPKGWDKRQLKDGFHLHDTLKEQLDILIKNVVNDWDFTIIISGSGEVRVGKSVLAMQIAAYWAYEMQRLFKKRVIFEIKTNIVFDGRKLIQQGNYLGQNYSFNPLVFDEAGADLEGKKAMQTITQDVLDFYRECGQYNLLNILVIPDFFDLPKGIALTRSMFLLDVYYNANEEGIFERGYFRFYSKRNKKQLYLKGKRELNYNAHTFNFRGNFRPFYPIDETEYRKAKQEALVKRENKRRNKFQMQRDACWYIFNQELGWAQEKIAIRMENLTGIYVDQSVISDGIRHYMSDDERRRTERK